MVTAYFAPTSLASMTIDDNEWICRACHKQSVISVSRTSGPSDVEQMSRGRELQIAEWLVKTVQDDWISDRETLRPSVVFVLGTDSDPVPANCSRCLPAMAEIAKQSYAKYVGAKPCRDL